MSTYEPALYRVTWTHPKLPYVTTTVVDLAYARSRGVEDLEAIRRIIAIARLDGLKDADEVSVIHYESTPNTGA